jgi:hypothetical protein
MTTVLQPASSATRIRQELIEAVLLDLLGPAHGPEEELDERNVRDRYLVGMLAPKRQELSPEEFDELAQGGVGSGEDGTADYSAPPARTMFPSSFGMTFCVDLTAEALQITACWGQYARVRSETLTRENGELKLVWKRTPKGGVSRPMPLQAGRFTWKPDPELPEVYVQGLVRKRDDHWSVTLFLVNGQQEPKKLRDQAWLFQPELTVECPKGQPVFHRRASLRDPGKLDLLAYAEDQEMAMLYRHCVEFAVGHGVSVHAEPCPGQCDRATRLCTRVAPEYEVARSTPPTTEEVPGLAGLVLDMKELAHTPDGGFTARLGPLVSAYEAWIAEQEGRLTSPDMAPYLPAGQAAIERCRETLARIKAGLELLAGDGQAADAFRFANRAMWQQRVRTIYALARRRGENADLNAIDADPRNHSWYPFQLAFLLLNLPGVAGLDHPERRGEADAVADLLWFGTGGGKTEAYLGLTAFTMGLRRLQKIVGGRSGEHGVAVLMRYTLRLLTIQQFQRAAALVCACETIRREDPKTWGETPFRIGLWVGQRTTPNTTDQSAEAVKQEHGHGKFRGSVGGGGSPAQLTNCPWCGSRIHPGRDIKVEAYQRGRSRTFTWCSDLMGKCPFSKAQSPEEGLPVLVVDEEVYRLLPALLIATVDKFAQMPWNGKVGMLFGQVDAWCPRHGFCSSELACGESHPKKDRWPAVRVQPHKPLRPPDLIIQDELHLISGPLGTLVGLYETAVDRLCSWEVEGRKVRPKVIASTATIRKAADQVHATFLRQVRVFPPQGLEVRDNFFSRQRPPSEQEPGRLYLGICSPGRRLKVALIRVYVAFLAAAQQLYERYGKAADPWMTLVGYFNSMRELGGMRRLVDDDVKSRLRKMDQRGLAKRVVDTLDELTSRKGSTEIPEVLDRLEVQFDPAMEEKRKKLAKGGARAKDYEGLPPRPIDVLLATNMVSVGVDVNRLGLMVVAGQPKTTAEYIQATSRVGRKFPGVVCTVYNWTRPRDLSHYETFEHYHATFYKHVEALSVTPFAPGAISRGLTALLVSCIRHQGAEFNGNDRAQRLDRQHPCVQAAVELIARRAHLVGNGAVVEQQVRAELQDRLDAWLAEAQKAAGGRVLAYDEKKDGVTVGLLRRPSLDAWDDFTCLNSLREVEPTASLILDDGGMDEDAGFTPAVSEDAGEEGDNE